jgi:hypothetical protein
MGVVGDVNHDDRPDLISGTNLLLGMTACHARTIVPLPDWPEHGGMALADLDGDANLDVVADFNSNVTIRTGNGLGDFAAPLSLPGTSGSGRSEFLFGDLNGDRKLDVIFARQDGWGVFLNTCR